MTWLDKVKSAASTVAEAVVAVDDAFEMKCFELDAVVASYLPGDNIQLDEYTEDGVDAAEAGVVRGAGVVKDKALQVRDSERVVHARECVGERATQVREWVSARKNMLRR